MSVRVCVGVIAFLISLTAGRVAAQAGDPVHIYATDWGLTLSSDGSGFYNDLARFLLQAPDVGPVDYEILPYRRANRQFIDDRASCKYPSSIVFSMRGGLLASPEGYIRGEPVVLTRVHLFAKPGQAPPTKKSDVGGKTIAYAMGARTPALLAGESALFIAVADEVDKARMLFSGRVDMIAAAVPDVEFVFRALQVETAPFAPDFAIDISPMGIDCHDTPANAAFLDRFNSRVRELKRTGALQAFYTSQGLDPDVYVPADARSQTADATAKPTKH